MDPPFLFKSVMADPERSVSVLSVELTMDSAPSALSLVLDQLMFVIRKSHCVNGEERDVEIAIREALDNAIHHGNRRDSSKRIHIRCRCETRRELLLVIRDEGQGFDPSEVVYPAISVNGKALSQRGLNLMRQYMDEVHFERAGTEVHMWKRCKIAQGNFW